MIDGATMKPCTKCNFEFPLDAFYRNRKSKDGRQSQCKECDRLRKFNSRVAKKTPALPPLRIETIRNRRALQHGRCAKCDAEFSDRTAYAIEDRRRTEAQYRKAIRLVCPAPPGCPDQLPKSFDVGEFDHGTVEIDKIPVESVENSQLATLIRNALQLLLAAAALLVLLHFALPDFTLPFL